MHLRAVSIRGFKSFAKKTILRFDAGVTVIVGPNGSGKSNITDAVLWVLGEQSAKMLRGNSMEDVIFSGSANKNALGAAEVSLTLDNSDGLIPIDFSEVVITRRLYRSGESDYMINRNDCRLIDIQEMLSDTGLGREMYSVISQGRLDDALNSKPSERRQLLEEAARVLKHKRRKDRALRKLGAMERNLTRGKDILREVNRQLAPLHKQADVAREHARLADELKEAQVAGAVGRLRRLRGQWEELATKNQDMTGLIEGTNLKISEVQRSIDELERELEKKGALAGDISDYRRRFAGLEERINSGLLLLEEKGKNLVAKISELRQTIHVLDRRVTTARQEREKLFADKEQSDEELGQLYQRLNKERRAAESVRKEAKKSSDVLAECESRLIKARERLAELQRETHRGQSLIESSTEKISFLREQLSAVTQKREELDQERVGVELEHGELVRAQPEREKLAQESVSRIEEDRRDKATATKRLETSTSELREARARAAALTAFESTSVRDFSWFELERDGFPEIGESISSVVTVEAKYERAIESALGHDAHALLAEDRSVASNLFYRAKERGEDPIRILTATRTELKQPTMRGLRRAAELVDCPSQVRTAIEALLGHVWVAEDLGDFVDGRRHAPAGGVVVDLHGDFIDGRGLIVRYHDGDNSQGSLATKRELSELEVEIERLAGAVETARTDLEDAEKAAEHAEEVARAAQTDVQKLDGRTVAVSLRVQNFKRDIERLDEQEVVITRDLADKDRVKSEGNIALAKLEDALSAADREVTDSETAYAEKKASQTAGVEIEKQAMAGLSEAQVAMASLTERQTHLKTRLISVEDELAQAEKSLEEKNKIVGATEELRHRVQPVHGLFTVLRLAAEERAKKLEEMDEQGQSGSATMREELRRLHQRARDLGADLNLANAELVAKAEAKSQVEAEVNQITRLLVDELDVALETALAHRDDGREPEDWAVRERRLRERMTRLGPVNQIAAGEFTKLEERQAFLTKQIDDLIRSQKALKKVIKVIEDKIRDKFESTFNEVNNNFNKVFQELFPGGSARLRLVEDEDSDEEPGVEIEAQPEGKRLQSLSLLSGGERSLVGLALMFSLHYTRPTPFYILDEVEAALDVINLQHFIRLMKKLKKKTQFLVITHQRPTMEIADNIYGVSMQADGISKVISQKLERGEQENGRREDVELVATAVGRPEEVKDKP